MKKLCSTLIIIFIFSVSKSQNANRLFDQPVKLKEVNFKIQSDAFVATTFIEMEFYNSNDKEVEGLYRFKLDSGQAITGFQLDVNGKYRDGSIEERWKARSTYSSIVGKRMDPALLQYEYYNNYRLNIFPIPAKGTKKITMTIQQLLVADKKSLIYRFPFYSRDTVEDFHLNIQVSDINTTPVIKGGILAGKSFIDNLNKGYLDWSSQKLVLAGEISFVIPMNEGKSLFCEALTKQNNYYALRLIPKTPVESSIHPKTVAICWDASGSATKRNLKKEINFLRQYISYYNISQLTIIPFTYTTLDTAVFFKENNFNSHWEQYLRGLNYDGATQLGCLDLSTINADVVLLFSDGKNSYGRSMPNTGTSLIYCINSARDGNITHLEEIVGSNGGKCLDLNKLTFTEAIISAGRIQNWLLGIISTSGQLTCDQSFPIPMDKSVLLTGIVSDASDLFTLSYGHGKTIINSENIFHEQQTNCSDSTIETIGRLQKFLKIQSTSSWNDILDLGVTEKVVTPYSSYIVLEKVEDYIKYNIAPPKDLEEECERLHYVKKDTRSYRQTLKEQDEFDVLNNVVHSYNFKIKQWDKNSDTIQFSREKYQNLRAINFPQEITNENSSNQLTGKVSGLSIGTPGSSAALNEVVVVGYGTALKKNLTGSVSYFRGNQIVPGLSIEENIAGRVSGVSVQSSGDYFTGRSSITIRGVSSIRNNNPLFIIDGIPVHGNPNNYINTNDIESITVLKDAASTAIYGNGGANGVIVINSKKGRNVGYYNYNQKPYRLKEREDVDYMQDLKLTSKSLLPFAYGQLRIEHTSEPGFYLDVAQYFFEVGLKQQAMSILLNGAEASDANSTTLKAIGYILEAWKKFADAIKIYEQLLSSNPNDVYIYRDLAWAYYQNGNYQEAVEILYKAIKLDLVYQEYQYKSIKAILLNDMNAIISIQKNKINTQMIPSALIKPLPVDLKITVEGNKNDVYDMTIIEPGGAKCSSIKPFSKHGGYMNNSDWLPNHNAIDYQIRNAIKGTYKVQVAYYGYQSDHIPSFIKITTFRNFGKADQSISIENVAMDNQYGEIQISEVPFK